MRINKKLKGEILALDSIHKMVESYQEIAAIRMRKVRNNVLQNREFVDGLNTMYGNISSVYKTQLPLFDKKKRSKDTFLIRTTNGKTVSIFLSANTGLYGDIIAETFADFTEYVKNNDTDVVIVGRYGRKLFESSGITKKFEYFDFSDSGVDEENSKRLLTYILQYENINVFHGFFQSVLTQISKMTAVTGSVPKPSESTSENAEAQKKEKMVTYIFEPTIEEVLSFFEKEILSAIFDQSVYESSLSKFASRMISMDYAMVRVKNRKKQMNFQVRKMKHRVSNSDQLGLLTSISLWGNQ